MSDGFWVEFAEVYKPYNNEWVGRYLGYFKTPRGHVRGCGHKHKKQEAAETCAKMMYHKTLRESR